VYITGAVGKDFSSRVPVFWKNGTPNVLPMGTGYAIGYAGALGIDRSGTVYITGSVGKDIRSPVPVYWKNGTLNALPVGAGNAFGTPAGIAVEK
jgi:predicted RecA/RadA family phage recombinase